MKKLSYVLVILFFYHVTVISQARLPNSELTQGSQSCLPEGITFTSQDEIDNFQTNYPNCTEIEGDVIIEGNDITNLNGLSVLNSISGFL